MSTPFMPQHVTEQMKQFETMTSSFGAGLPREMQGLVNLTAHPVAVIAAGSALGLGLASHAFGLWLGSAVGMAEAARRIMTMDLADAARDAEAFRAPKSPAARAKAAIRMLVADAETVARDTTAVAERTVRKAADDIEKTLKRPARSADAASKSVAGASEGRKVSVQPEPMAKPAAPDDLKVIAGIGPKLEMVLNDLGIWTYAQMAELGEAQIAWLDEKLGFRGRIGRDDWVGQAKALADKA